MTIPKPHHPWRRFDYDPRRRALQRRQTPQATYRCIPCNTAFRHPRHALVPACPNCFSTRCTAIPQDP